MVAHPLPFCSHVTADPFPVAPTAAALLQACRAVLTPLAELAIARGVRYGEIDELLRSAFVDVALAAHPDIAPTRAVSRISATTGLHRREVSRLIKVETSSESKRSPATQVFTRWVSDPNLRQNGSPLRFIARQGPAPSFEALAQSVTRDVHPRSLLEDLSRLGLVRLDEVNDRVELLRDRFAPAGDEPRMLGFVGSNVGDHLRAAVANVLADAPPHLEQALFADELSSQSLQQLQPLVRTQWQQLLRSLAPEVQKLIDDDQAHQRVQDQRLRVGLYAYNEPMHAAAPPAASKTASARRRTP
jgi:hypothetical protein